MRLHFADFPFDLLDVVRSQLALQTSPLQIGFQNAISRCFQAIPSFVFLEMSVEFTRFFNVSRRAHASETARRARTSNTEDKCVNTLRIYSCIALLSLLSLAVSGCSRNSDAEKARSASDSAARKAGEEAYKLAHKSKEAAQQAGRELRKTGNQIKAGWQDAKHRAQSQGEKSRD
jgi:hypothetical protein